MTVPRWLGRLLCRWQIHRAVLRYELIGDLGLPTARRVVKCERCERYL